MIRGGLRGWLAALAVLCAGAAPAHAAVYSYTFGIQTSNGVPVNNIALFAMSGAQTWLQFSQVVIPASGTHTITHEVPFVAEAVTVLGVAYRPAEDKYDLVQFTNASFASGAKGSFFGDLFPASAGYPRHSALIEELQERREGVVNAFLAGATMTFFNPTGSFKIIEYTAVGEPIGGTVPLPAGIFLLGSLVGAGLLAAIARRRAIA